MVMINHHLKKGSAKTPNRHKGEKQMASHEKEQPANALEIMNPRLYQMLIKRGIHDHQWAEYFLLINTCYEIIKRIPNTPEVCNEMDIRKLLNDSLERIGKTIWDILPGGADEFSYYMPDGIRREKAQAQHLNEIRLTLSQLKPPETN